MSYRKIFSVINEHTASTVTAHYAVSLAAAGKAELVLYAAHDKGSNETILRHADRHLDHLFVLASELGIPVTRISEVGAVGNLLPERVRTENSDLVFYPLSPFERYGTNLQRHTVHHLLRTVRSDLAIMRVVNMAKPHPRHILMPLGKIVSDREHRHVPALALGAERPSPDIMQRPPRPKNEHLLTRNVLIRAYLYLGMLEAGAGMAAYFYVMYRGGWDWGEPLALTSTLYLQATTACLAGIIATQIANVFACRSPSVSIITLGIFSNRLVLAGVATEALLAAFIIYTPIGNSLFASAPIGVDVWLLLIPFAILLLVSDELRKLFVKRTALQARASD